MQTFFTSDTHFDDEYAISYFNRPFKNVDEMNAVMIEKVVPAPARSGPMIGMIG